MKVNKFPKSFTCASYSPPIYVQPKNKFIENITSHHNQILLFMYKIFCNSSLLKALKTTGVICGDLERSATRSLLQQLQIAKNSG